jgi:hypothetical protein
MTSGANGSSGSVTPTGRPALFQQFLHFGCIERTELVNKPYS